MPPPVRPTPVLAALSRPLALEAGLGWPDLVALDVRYRVSERVGLGVSLGLGAGPAGALAPLSSYQAMPAVYLRYYMSRSLDSPYLQFGAGSQIAGVFNGVGLSAAPMILASYGYEWRTVSGLTASIDGGAAFNFNPNGTTSPALRIGLRFGYAAP